MDLCGLKTRKNLEEDDEEDTVIIEVIMIIIIILAEVIISEMLTWTWVQDQVTNIRRVHDGGALQS